MIISLIKKNRYPTVRLFISRFNTLLGMIRSKQIISSSKSSSQLTIDDFNSYAAVAAVLL